MKIHGNPAVIEDFVPESRGRKELGRRDTLSFHRRVHEGGGAVDDEQGDRSDQIQQHPERDMPAFLSPFHASHV